MSALSVPFCQVRAIECVHDVNKEGRKSGANWRFICCRGAFRFACCVTAAATRSGMQVAVACSDMRVGEEENSECGWYKHNESEVDRWSGRCASKRMEVRRRLSRSLGAEEGGYFHRESDISMSVLKRYYAR